MVTSSNCNGSIGAALFSLAAACLAPAAHADEKDVWHAPFGGTFNANFTVTSDYSYAGISNNALQPAFQPALDYRSPDLLSDPKLWIYLGVFGSNVTLPAGPGGERSTCWAA